MIGIKCLYLSNLHRRNWIHLKWRIINTRVYIDRPAISIACITIKDQRMEIEMANQQPNQQNQQSDSQKQPNQQNDQKHQQQQSDQKKQPNEQPENPQKQQK